jgi:hypothetical protein
MNLFSKMLGAFGGNAPEAPAVKPGRNDVCWCGSGRKYKKCHYAEDGAKAAAKACALNCGST